MLGMGPSPGGLGGQVEVDGGFGRVVRRQAGSALYRNGAFVGGGAGLALVWTVMGVEAVIVGVQIG